MSLPITSVPTGNNGLDGVCENQTSASTLVAERSKGSPIDNRLSMPEMQLKVGNKASNQNSRRSSSGSSKGSKNESNCGDDNYINGRLKHRRTESSRRDNKHVRSMSAKTQVSLYKYKRRKMWSKPRLLHHHHEITDEAADVEEMTEHKASWEGVYLTLILHLELTPVFKNYFTTCCMLGPLPV